MANLFHADPPGDGPTIGRAGFIRDVSGERLAAWARSGLAAAVERHREARRIVAGLDRRCMAAHDAGASYEDMRPLERVHDEAVGEMIDAERDLVRLILAANGHGEAELANAHKRIFAPAAVRVGGKLYVATPDPCDADEPIGKVDGGGCDMTNLLVIDVGRVVALD